MSVPLSVQQTLETEAFKRQREEEVEKASRICEELTSLMHETLVSLLLCFKEEQNSKPCGFYTSRFPDHEGETTFRDTAIVLTAIETAGKEIMDLTTGAIQEDRQKFLSKLAECRARRGKQLIAYEQYKRLFFEPCVGRILQENDNPLLLSRTDDETPAGHLRGSRDPFSCTRILGLLNLHQSGETHGKVYVKAVETVVGALSQSFHPTYAFGGASLTKTEPHAFVSYYCLKSLNSMQVILEQRGEEHKRLAAVLEKINEFTSRQPPTFLEFSDWQSFQKYLKEELTTLKDGVGLANAVKAIQELLKTEAPDSWQPVETSKKSPAETIRENLANEWTDWMGQFDTLVSEQVSTGDSMERTLLQELQPPACRDSSAKAHDKDPGADSMNKVKKYFRGAGDSWKRAFFQGMAHVLERIGDIYKELKSSPTLSDVTAAVRKASDAWKDSAFVTKNYISKFSKWATAELYRQLSFYHVRFKTNFDPVQLAFLLRIDNDLSPGENPELTKKGLDILFESQQQDGIWPLGAPLVFDRQLLQALYVANLEIIHAVLPLVKQYERFERYEENIERVFNWLRTNKKEIKPFQADVTREGPDVRIVGWCDEKVPEQGRIDVWLTALTLEFLNAYRDILMGFVNRRTVQHKYDWQEPKELPSWKKVIDPELAEAFDVRVATKIDRHYIRPFREVGMSEKNAMVLSGPPGTGKTNLAAAIAGELGWHLVTITPSDFVKEGIEKSENMARTLFNDLLKLRNTVVFFDEIDEMLKSRSATEKEPAGIAMLQFIVPGMLPKLQRLKKYGERSGVIIAIATNYRERLDPAVVRSGRIDNDFPIFPPDEKSRQLIIYGCLQDLIHSEEVDQKMKYMKFAQELSRFTGGWVYSEIQRLVGALVRKQMKQSNKAGKLFSEWQENGWKEKNIVPPSTGGKKALLAKGYTILEEEKEERSLDPFEVYKGRSKAEKEARIVFRLCGKSIGVENGTLEQWVKETLGISEGAMSQQRLADPC